MTEQLKKKITIRALQDIYRRKGYRLRTNGEANLFGVRSLDMTAGIFNDAIGLFQISGPQSLLKIYDGTVDPGSYFLNNPMNPAGTAVMKFQQITDGYVVGLHAGKYEALRQFKAMEFYRISKKAFDADGGKEIKLTGKPIQKAIIGANIHRANLNSIAEMVGSHSAGCQVIQRPDDWKEFLAICKSTGAALFDYTLFGEQDLNIIWDQDPKTEKRV